ncbi:hypothetical protein CPI83_29625 (plasmid) [Rhodococcus sp. H-CA8f]|uniref:type IV toxin-antitoxin system AbiEi family antitoxin domain-containing protein n=1 Tax=Rhodococcus sp. H-CA8f TaxID=1727214 RepID=UPI000BE300DB|nr:type IV toxin-antitoxin system AbiEi family antitoxin domain-containing protein [Rhodococcus sp. H-CA8f]ATI36363.1 hypothetical protein CPI83_29625 [Rhodococcus sp. H-CA8f]
MKMKDAANMVAEIAAEQWGIITTAQARAHDVTPVQMKRLTDRGALERVHHGIYTMTRMPYDPIQDIRIAWIALDPKTPAWDRLTQDFPTGVVSHRTAAKLHQLGDIDADWTEFTCQRRIRIDLPDIKIHTGTVEVKDWTTVEGLPVTTASRTVEDLAAAKIDGGHLASIAQDAIAQELATPDDLEKALAPHAFAYGHALNDGSRFLASLIEQAGVSTNTLRLADMATRYLRECEPSAADNASNTPRHIKLDPGALAFAAAESTGQFEQYLKIVSDNVLRDAISGLAAAQLDTVRDAVRASLSESVKNSSLPRIQQPALEAARAALSQAMAPLRQAAAENLKASTRSLEEKGAPPIAESHGGHENRNLPNSGTGQGDNS